MLIKDWKDLVSQVRWEGGNMRGEGGGGVSRGRVNTDQVQGQQQDKQRLFVPSIWYEGHISL